MRWTMARATVFCSSLCFGIAVFSVLGQRHASVRPVQGFWQASQAILEAEAAAPLQEQSSTQPVISFENVEVIGNGYTNTETIALRESPKANAAISAVLKLPNSEMVEILGATRDYLHVRFLAADGPTEDKNRESNREGWVAWGEVMPETSAIVLDTETGAVVSRVPLNDVDYGVLPAFSHDNSRVVFYSNGYAYEVETEGYTLKRILKAQLDGATCPSASFFYGWTDNGLYTAINQQNAATRLTGSMLNIVRVNGLNDPTPAPEISEWATDFAIAPNGRTGFILHPANTEKKEMLVDVLDLQGMRVRNTLTLRGENLPTEASEFVTSIDGRELYGNLCPGREVISVIDTSTGELLREIPTSAFKHYAPALSQQELVGDSLLFRVWEENTDVSHSIWLDEGKASKAQTGIDYAVEANGVRLAVNDSGTRLFKLDSDNLVREKYWIDRPDVRLDQGNAQSFGVNKFFASPDGKRIILILGTIHSC